MNALFQIGAESVADTADDYYTPHWIFDAAGLVFDLDVAAPVDASRRTCPARRYLTPVEDGLTAPWEGLVWMNPPYSKAQPWIDRFIAHGNGLALMPAMKTSYWVGQLLRAADAMALINVQFIRHMPLLRAGHYRATVAEISNILMLVGCGEVSAEAVGRVAAPDKYMAGAYFIPGRKLDS